MKFNLTQYKFSLLFIAGLFLMITSCNSSKSITKTSSFAPTAKENTLLWEVTNPENKSKSYIYGTIHLIPTKDFLITPELSKCIESVEQVSFEVDMAKMEDPMVVMSLMSKMMMPEGTSVADIVSKEDYALILEKAAAVGLPAMIIEKIKPVFLSIILEQTNLGTEGETTAYETEIYSIVKEKGKRSGGLETLEFQLSMFDSISMDTQAKMLVHALRTPSEGDITEIKKMIKAYNKRDLISLTTLMNQGAKETEMDMDAFLGDRNKNWVPLIINETKSTSILYAVGAGHLGGEDGVIALLRREGLIVKPLFETLTAKSKKIIDNSKMQAKPNLVPATKGH